MKFTDLTKEQQEHFKVVMAYLGEGGKTVPEDATFIFRDDPYSDYVIGKRENGELLYWDESLCRWDHTSYTLPEDDTYPIPEDFCRETNTICSGTWVEITNPSDIKKYPVGTKIKINGKENEIKGHYDGGDDGFDVELPLDDNEWRTTFGNCSWYQGYKVEVFVENSVQVVDKETTEAIQKAVESGNVEFEEDMVKKPNHYQLLPEYEVKDVMKALLDKIEESDFKMSHYEAGWYQQSMQYFLRFYAKNGLEDLEKGLETMQFVVDSIKQRKGERS